MPDFPRFMDSLQEWLNEKQKCPTGNIKPLLNSIVRGVLRGIKKYDRNEKKDFIKFLFARTPE